MELFVKSIRVDSLPQKGAYYKDLACVRSLQGETPVRFNSPVTFFVGENGAGKSTLLEAIAVACRFNAEGGTVNFNFETKATHSGLHEHLQVGRGIKRPKDGFFLRAESFYNVATQLDVLESELPDVLRYYGDTSLHEQSHGESFMALVANRFGGEGLYILDEPEAAFSPARQLELLIRIDALVKKHSQLIIATHSPMLMAYPGAETWLFDENGIQKIPYKETEHYKIAQSFFESPERMLRNLFEGEE